MARTWTDEELKRAVAGAKSIADVCRALGIRAAGGNHRSVKRHIARLSLDMSHFDPWAALRGARPTRRPLADVLVIASTYSRTNLKRRLFEEGLKLRACELCGQGEHWRGRRLSLILDHVNGIHDDNRLENLRIVCPNCAATFETHCGKQLRVRRDPRTCRRCGDAFTPNSDVQRYCSRTCGTRGVPGERAAAAAAARGIDRPPLDELRRRIDLEGYQPVAREYGVSDNAIRKWFRSAGQDPPRRYVRRRPGP